MTKKTLIPLRKRAGSPGVPWTKRVGNCAAANLPTAVSSPNSARSACALLLALLLSVIVGIPGALGADGVLLQKADLIYQGAFRLPPGTRALRW